jgi:hypothetical protein
LPVKAGFNVSGEAKNCEKLGSCAFKNKQAVQKIIVIKNLIFKMGNTTWSHALLSRLVAEYPWGNLILFILVATIAGRLKPLTP